VHHETEELKNNGHDLVLILVNGEFYSGKTTIIVRADTGEASFGDDEISLYNRFVIFGPSFRRYLKAPIARP